jgi:hypothetical protein
MLALDQGCLSPPSRAPPFSAMPRENTVVLTKGEAMRTNLRMTILMTMAIALALALPANANAYVPIGHKLKYGVGDYGNDDQHYYIASSASGYDSTISAAMSEWVHTTSRLGITTPISYTKTSTQSSSRMDFHAGDYHPASKGRIADTYLYVGDTRVDPNPTTNWVWGKTLINKVTYNTLSASNKKGSCAHEMGHTMGLDENPNKTGSVMCPLGAGRTVYNAQKDDCNGINAIY